MSKHPLTFNFARFAIILGALLGFITTSTTRAQVTVDISISRTIYIAYEPLLVTVKITNLTGSKLLLSNVDYKKWLGFEVETLDGRPIQPVDQDYKIPTPNENPIQPGDSISYSLLLNQLYPIDDLGSYRIRAVLYAAELSSYFRSPPLMVEITEGRLIWQQTVGMPKSRMVPVPAQASGTITNIESREGSESSLVIIQKDGERYTNSIPASAQIKCTNGAFISKGDCLATISKPYVFERVVPILAGASGTITNIESREGSESSNVIIKGDSESYTNSIPAGAQIKCKKGEFVSEGDCLATIVQPLTRTISLMSHRFNDRTDLYLRIQDKGFGTIYCTHRLGDCLSFGKPEIQLDSENTVHVLQNNAPREFIWSKVDLDGKILSRLTYSSTKERPQLVCDSNGSVSVLGGVLYDPKASATPTVIPKLSDRPVSFNEPIPSLTPEKPTAKSSPTPLMKKKAKPSPSPSTVRSRPATNATALPASQID